jgi:hypothetical protein
MLMLAMLWASGLGLSGASPAACCDASRCYVATLHLQQQLMSWLVMQRMCLALALVMGFMCACAYVYAGAGA